MKFSTEIGGGHVKVVRSRRVPDVPNLLEISFRLSGFNEFIY